MVAGLGDIDSKVFLQDVPQALSRLGSHGLGPGAGSTSCDRLYSLGTLWSRESVTALLHLCRPLAVTHFPSSVPS